jgi:hypothetical protein
VVVTFQPLPIFRGVLTRLRGEALGGRSQPSETEPVLFVDVEELEGLCAACAHGQSLSHLLRSWTRDPQHSEWPLANFLYARNLGRGLPSVLDAEVQHLMQGAREILRDTEQSPA